MPSAAHYSLLAIRYSPLFRHSLLAIRRSPVYKLHQQEQTNGGRTVLAA
jgi:hypothetical protein